MAETVLSFGVEKLGNLLVRESERFQGVEEQFNGLKSGLNKLRSFLEDADAKKHTKATVKNTVEEIREIVYDAEDIIETFVLKEERGTSGGICNLVGRCVWIFVERRGLASDMEALRTRISKVISDMQSLGVRELIVNETYSHPLQKIQREVRQTYSSGDVDVDDDHLVGLKKNVDILVGYLVEENSSPVVSITGMGGIGKTTRARQVFIDEKIKSHFPRLAWVCVSQQLKRKDVWQTILRQLQPEYKVSEMAEEELQEKLVRVLEIQKALIVIDDIWEEGDWDRIKQVFLPKKGWKVLLTSRNEGVALHADPKCTIFRPECLTFEESLKLFQMIAFPNTTDYKADEEMEEMIKCCGGLPLALRVLGGLLAGKEGTSRDWKRIYGNFKSHIMGGTSFNERNFRFVYQILYLSYEELPIYLKHCFLYLAHFPEDYETEVVKLSYYWAAEGIPRPENYKRESIEDVADSYIEELVKRNMVISKRDGRTSRYKICRLHDMMREVCLLKAKEENFVQSVQGASTANPKSSCKSRRLAVHWFDETFHLKNPSLRSILMIHCTWKASELRFTGLQLMRILDLSGAKFEGNKVPSSIGTLIHLRYLSLFWANVTHLPSSMRNLKQLIYLNLRVSHDSILYIPNILKEMRELRYLELPSKLHDKVKMELGNLVNLETLKDFSTEHGNVRDLQVMTRLETLSIVLNGRCSVETLSSVLSELKHLEYLTIDDSKYLFNYEEEFVLGCVHLHLRQLEMWIYMPRLPDEQHVLSHLTTLSLRYCRLEEDPMPILEKLLRLKEIQFGVKAFSGSRMVCSRGGFPQLQKLRLSGLEELEEWKVEEGSMPLLHTLEISDCTKLKELRDGLRFITSLKNVSVRLSEEEWKNKFSEEHLPSRLTTIRLSWCFLEEDPMPILEKLFHLKEVELWSESFCGRRMVCSRGGFPQLQRLEFFALDEWEEWTVEEGSMPLLHTLEIDDCKKLKEFPDGLRFIYSLKNLTLEDMGEEWKKRLSEEGKDYHKIQHIPSVTFKGE